MSVLKNDFKIHAFLWPTFKFEFIFTPRDDKKRDFGTCHFLVLVDPQIFRPSYGPEPLSGIFRVFPCSDLGTYFTFERFSSLTFKSLGCSNIFSVKSQQILLWGAIGGFKCQLGKKVSIQNSN